MCLVLNLVLSKKIRTLNCLKASSCPLLLILSTFSQRRWHVCAELGNLGNKSELQSVMGSWKEGGAVRIDVVLHLVHGTCIWAHSLWLCFTVGWLLSPSLDPCPLIKQNTCMFWEVLATHPCHCHPGSAVMWWKKSQGWNFRAALPTAGVCSGLCTNPLPDVGVGQGQGGTAAGKEGMLQPPLQMLKSPPPAPPPLTKTPWLFLLALSQFFRL